MNDSMAQQCTNQLLGAISNIGGGSYTNSAIPSGTDRINDRVLIAALMHAAMLAMNPGLMVTDVADRADRSVREADALIKRLRTAG